MSEGRNAGEPVARRVVRAGPAPTIIDVRLNGQGPYRLVVDTGATVTVVSPDVAEELGLEPFDRIKRRGAGGEVVIDLAKIETVRIGDAEREDDVIGISQEGTRLCRDHAVGNIGYDILQHFILRVDARSMQASLLTEQPTDMVSDAVPFRIGRRGKSLILLPATLDDRGPFPFALDTGAMATCISPALAAELSLTSGDGPAVKAVGIGGPVNASFASRSVSLGFGNAIRPGIRPLIIDIFGPETKRDVADIFGRETKEDVAAIDEGGTATDDSEVANHVGLIGADALQGITLTVDYPNRQLWVDHGSTV